MQNILPDSDTDAELDVAASHRDGAAPTPGSVRPQPATDAVNVVGNGLPGNGDGTGGLGSIEIMLYHGERDAGIENRHAFGVNNGNQVTELTDTP